ncbi:MAG: ABC transporter permease [Clostridia bacterium]|nr:ABC transporter permease [Clostridia bacterium]
MNKLDLLKLARQNLWRRKMRTFLTVLGVLIGTTSIVVMLSLGIGLDDVQKKQMERWGSLTMTTVRQGMVYDKEGNPQGDGKQLNDEAVEEIKNIKGVIAVSPAYDMGGEARFGRMEGYIQLIGIDAGVMDQLEFETTQGRLLKSEDRNVIVVGNQVINNFRDEKEIRRMQRDDMMMYDGPRHREDKDPTQMLDQRVSMLVRNGSNSEKKKLFNFTVVGILEGEYNEHSYQAYAPIDDIKKIRKYMMAGNKDNVNGNMVMERSMRAGSRSNERKKSSSRSQDDYNSILVRTEDVEMTKSVSQGLKDMGYNCWSMADQLEGIEKTSRIVQAILGGIGGITLLVAALGITNTMIMSIYERTKEIGIMKVIGATFSDVYLLFLTEAGMIGFLGGLTGIGLSYGVSRIVNNVAMKFMGGAGASPEDLVNISLIPPWLAVFALGFAVLIGVVAGLYPAYRAVRLSPISAIRSE